jgi:DNA-binding transcriptional LysR family regulator
MLAPRRLVVLREFVARGTIAGAAEALAFTPSAVSQQLAQLQREAGVELFRKAGRRLELTDAGRMLAERAGGVLAELEQLEADLAQVAGVVRGVVRVAAFQTAARALVMPALARLATAHPELRVELVELEAEESLPVLARGGLDVAIAEEYEHAPRPRLPELHRDDLAADELVLTLPRDHDAARSEGALRLGTLRATPWATARAGTNYADMFVRVCRSAGGFEPEIHHRVNDLRMLLDLVASGGVAALLPALGEPAEDPRVAVRPLVEGPFARALFVATRAADRGRPSTAAVVDALREESGRGNRRKSLPAQTL